jgi:hypothetical protein
MKKKIMKKLLMKSAAFACVVLGSFIYWSGCHSDSSASRPRVEGLQFVNPKIEMKIGERQAVKVDVKPAEARRYANVTYTPSVEGYVTVSETSNDGCVLTAEKGGTVVIVARAGGYTAYLEVKIEGSQFEQVPYIMVPTQVIEVLEGARKTAQVSLYNGSAADQQQFIWEVEAGKDNISINPTGNTVVVQGEKRGSQKIIIRHDKSEYCAEILVFVLGADEQVRYITSGQNVITMRAGGPSHELVAVLVGGKITDNSGFTFKVKEENPCIEILSSNNSCSISAKWKGSSVILIEHPMAEYALEVRVIVSDENESYIELDQTFMLLDIGKSGLINAGMEGYYLHNWNADWKFVKRGDVDCIDVNQTNYQFYVMAKEAGKCIVEISNANIRYSREVLVVVRDPKVIAADEYYITTSQNVMQLEVGQSGGMQLSIQLINGIEADKSGFEWTVEDGSVIKVEPLDLPSGKEVNYRGMKNRAVTEIKGVANTLAWVTPLKVGSTKIIIEHYKSKSAATVIVKVYPRGTFGNMLNVLGRKEGSLVKVDTTIQNQTGKDTPVNLYMVEGSETSIGNLLWEIKGRSLEAPEIVASIQNVNKLDNEIHGISKGVNRLVVSNNDTLKYPYEAAVIVGTTDELASMAVLYVDQAHQRVAVGQSVSVPVLNSNMADGKPNGLSEDNSYYVENYDKTILSATMIKNRLLLQGLSDGFTSITVKNRTGTDIIPCELQITVVPGNTTIDKPYMLTGQNFVGMNWGDTNVEHKVKLSGDSMDASAVEKDRVKWSSSNGNMVRVTGSGETVLLTAGNGTTPSDPAEMTGQANITASHDKSVNEKTTVVYVVPPGIDPMKAVVLGIAKDHWLLKTGDEVMMYLLTNADETADRDINKIEWRDRNGIDYRKGGSDGIIDVDYNGTSAMVRAKAKGSTVITVTHPSKVIDLKIYVSVSDTPPLAKNITLPSIVELIIDENKVLTAVADGLETSEINGIEWSIDDAGVAGISSDLPVGADGKIKGAKLFIKGKARGQAWITASQGELGYVKKILVVCAKTYEELMSTYVMACENSFYRLKKGDVRGISLVYGAAGFPEMDKLNITWEDVEKNNVIKIHPPMGDYAEIEAVNEGIAKVRISHDKVLKPVDLTFEVTNELSIGGENYKFLYNGMMGLVVWKGNDGDSRQYQEPYTKTAALSISPAGLPYGGIEWADEEKPDKNIVKVMTGGAGNEYMVTGKAKGQTYLRFSHKSGQIGDDARVLVYTADSETELQQMFPIGISKVNYLLTIGDAAETVRILVPQQAALGLSNAEYRAKLDKISWDYGSRDSSVLNYTININDNDLTKFKQEISIQGRSAGNCYFDLKYNGILVERIYISVKVKLASEMNKRIVTESIVGLSPNMTNRKTSIGSNLTVEEKDELEWRTKDSSIVDIQVAPGDKTSCYLNARGMGETEVVVSFRQIERFIKVYVDNNADQYKAVNLDNRYYQLRRNDVLSLTAFHAALPCGTDDNWEFYPLSSPFDNKVVELRKTGKDKVDVTGINEGISTIVLYNGECETDVTFMVEVCNTAPLIETVTEDWYLTALKTVYALDPARTMDVTRVSVNGMRFTQEELVKIEWTVVSENINGITHVLAEEPGYKAALLTFNNRRGSFVDIMPNNKKGTAVIRAGHPRSVNDMDITVICDAEMALANPVPHIVTDKETVKLQLNEEADVAVSIAELYEGYDIAQFTAESDNPQKVSVNMTGNRLKIKGVNFGQTLVTITHPKVEGYAKKIVVIVMAGDTSLVYLTTRQNFVALEKGNYQAVEVELVGYSDVNNRNYIWSTDDQDIISINDSGKSAVITAKNVARTAKVMVQHIACLEYPLFIYVRVTEKNSGNPVYITTPNNIVSIKEGAGIQVKADLVNGGGHELSQFNWSTNHKNLIELNYSGDTAMIKGITPGTAQIQIWHPSSLNAITMLVVVEPLEPNNGIYITTDSQLIEMTTAESQRSLKARLVGGNPEDVYGFRWEITSFSSVLKQGQGQSYQPISLLANADTCYIQPVPQKYEGEAVVTISHPKTNYKLDVKVILTDAADIRFGQSYVTLDQYKQEKVNITAPSNGAINVYVDDNRIASAYVTNSLCIIEGKQKGTTVVRVSNLSGTKSDEIIVNVRETDLTNYAYININEGVVWNIAAGEYKTLTVQINGAQARDEEALLDLLQVKIDGSANNNNQYLVIDGINGKTQAGSGRYVWTLQFKALKAGNCTVTFEMNINAAGSDKLFNTYPALKTMVKSVYFKVLESDSVFSVDKRDMMMYSTSAGETILATIDTLQNTTFKASEIKWTIEDPAIITLAKIIPNDNMGTCIAYFNAEKAGNTFVSVKFGNYTTKIVYVTVNAVEFVRANITAITIAPGGEQEVLITSYPANAKITVSQNSNVGCDVYQFSDVKNGWVTASDFTAGENGRTIKIKGTNNPGSVKVIFTMETNPPKSAFINVTNIKNNFIRLINKTSWRFGPDADENSKDVKLFYECNNPDDYLEFTGGGGFYDCFTVLTMLNGEVLKGEVEEAGVKKENVKYIHLKHPQGKNIYPTGSYDKSSTETPALTFRAKLSGEEIEIPAYVYWDKIDVKWERDMKYNQGAKGSFDPVTYAISLGPNKGNELRINLTADTGLKQQGLEFCYIGDTKQYWDFKPVNGGKKIIVQPILPSGYAEGFTISRELLDGENSNSNTSNPASTTYLGILTVKYGYHNGGSNIFAVERKFLIYANKYY